MSGVTNKKFSHNNSAYCRNTNKKLNRYYILSSSSHSTYSFVIHSYFSSRSSKHHKSQAVRARELKFGENVHPSPCVTCHLSCVTCHVSRVTCHVSPVTSHLSPVTFFGGGASRWRVCFNRPTPSSLDID